MAETYDPSQLLKAVPLSDQVSSLVGTTEMDEDAAILLLLRRFGFAGELGSRDAYRLDAGGGERVGGTTAYFPEGEAPTWMAAMPDMRTTEPVLAALMRTIVKALPAEYRNELFLANVDVRPWMKELVGKTIKARSDNSFLPDNDVAVTVTAGQVDPYITAFTRKNRDELLAQFAGSPNFEALRTQVENALDYGTVAGRIAAPTDIAAAGPGGDGLVGGFQASTTSNDLSLDDLRRLFTREGMTEIMQLESLYSEYGATFDLPDDPTLDVSFLRPTRVNPTVPRTADHTERSGTGAAADPSNTPGARIGYKASADYLYSGQVTPTEITNLQRRMVAAGLFDGNDMADGYAAGDAFDANTNRAWQRLLGEQFRRNLTLVETIDVLTRERNERMPTLRENVNKRVFNLTAQQIIGRDLTDQEQAGLVSYLTNLRNQQGTAQLGTSPDVGFASDDVNTYLAGRFDSEIEGLGGAASLDAYKRAMRG